MSPGFELREQLPYFGYVYMWCDVKRNMFYIGSHKGSVYDKYKSGSKWLNDVIKNRPGTLKMMILEYYYGDNREILYNKEEKWLTFYNVENNSSFYNFKNKARGGCGPNKHKGKRRSDISPNWVDSRKGKKAEEIYSDPEKWRKNISDSLREEYLKTGCGRRKGVKNKNRDPRKGKTVEEIYGYRRVVNPNRPFLLRIEEPNGDIYEIFCDNENDFFKSTKLEESSLRKLKNEGKKKIERVTTLTKHNFPTDTLLKLNYL